MNFDFPIAHELIVIYEYMLHSLIEANIKKNVKLAEEVLVHLADLRETWVEASRMPEAVNGI